jgi:sodium transport system permease protein
LLLVFRFVLSLFGGLPDSWDGYATVTAVSLVATIGLPAIIFAVIFTRNASQTLLLHVPRLTTLPMVVLLAIALHPLAFLMSDIVTQLYPFSPEVTGQLHVMQRLIDRAPNAWMVLLVLAVTPAICEELAFRGFILSGLRHMGHKWLAILVTSVLFGAAHSVIQQSLTACVMGVILGYIAIQTGSLLPAILFHCVHNSLAMLLSRFHEALPDLIAQYPIVGFFVTASDQGPAYQWPTVVLSVWLTIRTLQWFGRQQYEHTREESRQEALDHQATNVSARFVVNESCGQS